MGHQIHSQINTRACVHAIIFLIMSSLGNFQPQSIMYYLQTIVACTCVCECVWGGGKREKGRKRERCRSKVSRITNATSNLITNNYTGAI